MCLPLGAAAWVLEPCARGAPPVQEEHVQSLLLSVMLSPPPSGASQADLVLGLALLALLANAGELCAALRCAVLCCAVLCCAAGAAGAAHLAGWCNPQPQPLPLPLPLPIHQTDFPSHLPAPGYLARLQCITLVQAFYAGDAAAQDHVRCLLEEPTRWALDEQLMELMGGVLGLALGATCASQPPAKAAGAGSSAVGRPAADAASDAQPVAAEAEAPARP